MPNTKSWYCLCINTPLNEAPILRALRHSKEDIDFYYPKYKAERHLKKKIRPLMRPVFSTYAFIKCTYTQNLKNSVEEVQGCYFVPSASATILPIDDLEMEQFKETIKEYITSGTVAGKHIQQNTQVEIISGALAGYQANIKAVIKDVVIAEISMFSRVVPITLKLSEISAL